MYLFVFVCIILYFVGDIDIAVSYFGTKHARKQKDMSSKIKGSKIKGIIITQDIYYCNMQLKHNSLLNDEYVLSKRKLDWLQFDVNNFKPQHFCLFKITSQ